MADELPSKTQRKKQMHDLQALGEALVVLTEQQLASLDLPERLLDAVVAARAIGAGRHEARRRQMQYIGKLMRSVDAEPIRAQLEAWKAASRRHTARLHRVEDWRARLLADPGALAEFVREHPHADAADLRRLVHGALTERAAGQPPRSFRNLFRALDATLRGDLRASGAAGVDEA